MEGDGGTIYYDKRGKDDRCFNQRRRCAGNECEYPGCRKDGNQQAMKVKGHYEGYAGLLQEEIVDMDGTSVADTIGRGGTIQHVTSMSRIHYVEARS